MRRCDIFLFMIIWVGMLISGAAAAEELQVMAADGSAQISFQALDSARLLVSVTDAGGNPIRGLKTSDFKVGTGIRKGRILKAEPFETNEEIPLNIVLVVDNSFSMLDRLAVKPLLAALDDFFDTVRPIDNVQAVVFKKGDPIAVKQRALHVERFKSSSPSELKAFFKNAYGEGMTGKTYLHEAILAGLDVVQKMPPDEQKFMVVFSDGEDLNSDYETDQIEIEAFGIENFSLYCVDYMPKPEPDEFLSAFALEHGGRIWKATSAAQIQTIFAEFTSTLMFRYILTYDLPNPLVLQPAELNLEVLTTTDGAPVANRIFFQSGSSTIPKKYQRFADASQTDLFEEKSLRAAEDRYFGLLNIAGQRLRQNPAARVDITGSTSDARADQANPDLALQRAGAVKDYLKTIWGIEEHRLSVSVADQNQAAATGQQTGARAERQCAEIVYTATELQERVPDEFVAEKDQVEQLTVVTHIFMGAEPKDWELSIFADDHPIHSLSGRGEIQPEYRIALDELGPGRVASASALEARISITDKQGKVQEASSDLCHIRRVKRELIHALALPPGGSLRLEPERVKIEELTMIDSSPLLNYIFFDSGQSEIPDRYVRLAGRSETDGFTPHALNSTMEKYYHVLNILGKRLRDNPAAAIRIVGCNSNHGQEHGRLDLSRSRAESIKAYLHYVWAIESSRLAVEARNLPEVASNNRVAEGRAENQRVEIYSEDPQILETVKSTYVVAVSDTANLRIVPEILTSYALSSWQLQLIGDDQVLESLRGTGELAPVYSISLEDIGLQKMGAYRSIIAKLEVEDKQGQKYSTEDVSELAFVKREQRVARKEGYKVMEKYALILFDFDRTDIKARNQQIVGRIIERISSMPSATVRIVGHTDTIGKEAYNISLSERRAKAAYEQMQSAGLSPSLDITHAGAGPFDPMYDNQLPEGRALNRTVTVTIEYEQNLSRRPGRPAASGAGMFFQAPRTAAPTRIEAIPVTRDRPSAWRRCIRCPVA